MSALLFQMANTMMNIVNNGSLLNEADAPVDINSGQWGWVGEVVDAIDMLLYPFAH